MTLLLSSGLRKNRSAIPRFAARRPPGRLWLAADVFREVPSTACDLQAEPLPLQIWMSAATRARACALQDAPGLALSFRLALLSLTRLYALPDEDGADGETQPEGGDASR